MKKMTEKEALLRLTALCSQAEHCSHEMQEKMRRWELDDEEQARVMEYLVKHQFIDDERFARYFVVDKIKYNKWGPRKVEQALWMKRVDDNVRQRVMGDVGDEEYLKVLRPLLRSKRKSVKAASDYELNVKLTRFALGRGFTFDQVRQCLDGADDVDVADDNQWIE